MMLQPWCFSQAKPFICAECTMISLHQPQESEAGARKRVNQLFKADFFGEGALLSDEPR